MSKGSVDKVVVLNQAALTAKYGAAAPTIDAAITTLIAADMAAVSGAPVIAPGDDQGAKAAIDAIYAALAPDYMARTQHSCHQVQSRGCPRTSDTVQR